ncbi:MAG TPA: molybdenum cofactor biosynthesis protein MoaE [Phycisphaerae bacterium]|nr:molybdenum cofactor biosynthesis protein MoaE [Phycisphaerae bacterium]
MNITVELRDGPLVGWSGPPEAHAGAVVRFEGIVRPQEDGRSISGLDYTAYEPMASRELKRLADSAMCDFDLQSITVLHSRGFVPVGRCSFILLIVAMHRRPALAAMDWFIDALKRDVPIWKHPVWVNTVKGL